MQNYKDPQGNVHVLDDVEFEHLLPAGCVAITEEEAQQLQALAAVMTPEEQQGVFAYLIQQRLDSFAQTRNYDNILSACTYATSGVAKFKAEGQACVNLRDTTWEAAYQILAEVKTGKRPMPTSIVDIEADLPAVVWPK